MQPIYAMVYKSEPTKDLAGMGLFFAFLSLKGASCAYSRRSASLLRAAECKKQPHSGKV